MLERRRLLVGGAVSLACLVMSRAGRAQSPFADLAGEWEGVTNNNVKLALYLRADGLFALKFQTGPGAGSMPRDRAVLKDGLVLLKYADTEIALTRTADGKLEGPFTTPRSRGTVTFIRK